MTLNRFWILRSLSLCLALACFSGVSAQAEPRMGLVGPGVGWAILNQPSGFNLHIPNHHLYWTSDDGANWKDITPQDPASHEIAGVFFLDALRGWVLLALKREPGNVTDIFGFDLASTTDGGSSWTIKRLSSLAEGDGWTAAAQIFFLDAAHGWMDIESPVPHWGGEGVLLATTDGGNTWKAIEEVGGGGGYGAIRFTDPQNGWIAGGPGGYYLYATNDGGRHWREVAVPAPFALSGDVAAQYSLPRFTDAMHGLLAVRYSGPGKSEEGVDILALFSTDNGGRTWHLESWLDGGQTANIPIISVVDSTAVVPKRLGNAGFALVKLRSGGKSSETKVTEVPELTNNTALVSLNFSDANHGWASASDGRLLSTIDGGVTWKDITPGKKKIGILAPSNIVPTNNPGEAPLPSSPVPSPTPVQTAASTITSYKSRHLGFDTCAAPPQNSKSPQMATWWTSSPYFDIGIYVGGSNRTCPQPNLISSWVSAVTNEGWGLIPLWVGPQAPCNSRSFSTYIDTSGGAYAQGQAEADKATKGSKSAMANLGLSAGSVIYYDIENYAPSATCNGNPTGSYVNSFLSGWVSEIQLNGYIAGVYGNTAPAASWNSGGTGYGAVSPSPTDVWITNPNNANSNLTIWGLTSGPGSLSDAAWPHDQRIRQYFVNTLDTTETWGGQGLVIDKDIEDADVTGGKGAKTYSFTYTTLPDFPGAANGTAPLGINNSAQIVGYYADSTGQHHGYVYDYNAGTFTGFDCPNSTQTDAYGINNSGSVVGLYVDQSGPHGFLYQAGICTGIDVPGAIYTEAFGINDDTQICGYYQDSLGGVHGFLYQPANSTPFTSFDYPGGSGTNAYGINGDAQVAGGCPNPGTAFLYYGGSFTNPPLDCAVGVNNNEQVTGSFGGSNVFEHESNYVIIQVPGASSTNSVYSPADFINTLALTAKVAFVGSYYSNVNGFHGFIATSQ